jgi:hypothetical protein
VRAVPALLVVAACGFPALPRLGGDDARKPDGVSDGARSDASLASWCVQNGDPCSHDGDCCGGLCDLATMTCAQPMIATACSAGVDGEVCTDCTGCCSRLCEVYEPTGQRVCQPTRGCRVNGELCFSSNDCCGGDANAGLPGSGNVSCTRQNATDPVGRCSNPIACSPEGTICHYQNFTTCGNNNARNDCCAAPGNTAVCKLDPLGIPRCYGLGPTCRMGGQTCSNPNDCCNGVPCVPNAAGQLVCSAVGPCVSQGGPCTQTADCCSGATCNPKPGSTTGTCGTSGTCAQQGQTCNTTTLPCCASSGTCTDASTSSACSPTSTLCTCFVQIL